MAGKDILLGIDFGSGGCKVTAIDTDGFLQGDSPNRSRPTGTVPCAAHWRQSESKALISNGLRPSPLTVRLTTRF